MKVRENGNKGEPEAKKEERMSQYKLLPLSDSLSPLLLGLGRVASLLRELRLLRLLQLLEQLLLERRLSTRRTRHVGPRLSRALRRSISLVL